MISAILITLFIIVCLWIVSDKINQKLGKELKKQVEINKQMLGLFQNERDKTDTLYRIILHIRDELSLLKLKGCPEDEFKKIPFEIIDWINLLTTLNSNDGGNDGIHKQD